jgi:hypothetical protein
MISMKQTIVNGERSRALTILAENPGGCTRAVMLGRGFPLALIASLIRAGLATDHRTYAPASRASWVAIEPTTPAAPRRLSSSGQIS